MNLATREEIGALRARSGRIGARVAATADLALDLLEMLRGLHDEQTNHGHQELSECECKLAAVLRSMTTTFCSKQCRKRLSPPRDCPYCACSPNSGGAEQ